MQKAVQVKDNGVAIGWVVIRGQIDVDVAIAAEAGAVDPSIGAVVIGEVENLAGQPALHGTQFPVVSKVSGRGRKQGRDEKERKKEKTPGDFHDRPPGS